MNDTLNRTPRRALATSGAFLVGATMALVGAVVMIAPAASATASPAESHIHIVQTPSEVQGNCSPSTMGLSRVITNNATSFKLTIAAAAPPCAPIDAVAAIYAMPGNGTPWPQTLAERMPFRIDKAGVTEVTFDKTCDAVQFDVLTGATPKTIAPLGEWHGPLLFPLDLETSLQYFGSPGCNPATTTTTGVTTTTGATTTTTEAPTTTTTTTPPQVLGTTIVAPTTTASVAVLDKVETSGGESPDSLAVTGFSSKDAGLIGGGLLVMGAGLMLEARRRLN